MRHNKHTRKHERGNVFIFILLGVVLFAALTYTVSNGMRSDGTSNLSKRQIELAATDILNYAKQVENAIDRLRRKGCSENELSFEHDEDGDGDYNDNSGDTYYNPNARADLSCHIFHPSGGNVRYSAPLAEWLDATHSSALAYGTYFFPDRVRVMGIGEDCAANACVELIMEIPHLKQSICEKINNAANISTIEQTSAINYSYGSAHKFTGSFNFQNVGATSTYGDNETNLIGKPTGCLYRNNVTSGYPYVFYHILLAR